MATRGTMNLADTLRRTLEANSRYYQAMANATASYLEALATVLSGAAEPRAGSTSRSATSERSAPTAPAPQNASPDASASSTLVLEGVAGQSVQAAFAVNNSLHARITTDVECSPLVSEDGSEAAVRLTLEPTNVTLEPNERREILLTASFDERQPVGVAYRGRVRVPNLSNAVVPVLVRRKAAGASRRTGAGQSEGVLETETKSSRSKPKAKSATSSRDKKPRDKKPTGRTKKRSAGA